MQPLPWIRYGAQEEPGTYMIHPNHFPCWIWIDLLPLVNESNYLNSLIHFLCRMAILWLDAWAILRSESHSSVKYTFSNVISDNYYLIVWHFSISSLLATINLTHSPIIQCRNAVWLPGPTLEASVTTDTCQSCGPGSAHAPVTQWIEKSNNYTWNVPLYCLMMFFFCDVGPVYKIRFKFRQIRIPPGFDVNHLGMQILSNMCNQLCAYLSILHHAESLLISSLFHRVQAVLVAVMTFLNSW